MTSTQRLPALAAGLALALLAGSALAEAPQPAKPVPQTFFSGKWFEIARTPNVMQKDCEGANSQFTATDKGRYAVVQTCRKGSPTGPAKRYNSKGDIVPGTNNAKFRMSFLGGLRKQEYWILDRSEEMGWAIMATPGGNYVWLLSRQPVMEGSARQSALTRIKALGYDTARLVFPQH
jgi:apolipoprotein D and lipocalin family protein